MIKRIKDKICISIMLVLFMTSCKVGREFSRPTTRVKSNLMSVVDETSVANLPWTSIYRDTLLNGLIEESLLYNKDLLIAAERLNELAAQKRISASKLFPQLDAEIGASRKTTDYGGDDFKGTTTINGKFLASWEVDLWGNLRWGREAAVAEYLMGVESRRALQMTLIAEVATAYYELVAMDNELQRVKQTLEARKEGVRLARLRFEGGLTSETPYQQAQVEVARTATLVPDLEKRISQKENDIAFLVGRYPSVIERSNALDSYMLSVDIPYGLPSDLLERRPDIREAEQRLRAANAKVGVAYTNLFPKLTITAKGGFENSELSDFFKSPYSLIDGALLSPIFKMGKHRSELKAQKALYQQELYRYEKSVLNALKETHNAIISYEKSKEIYDLKARLERTTRNYVEMAQFQYIKGVISYMEVLDAQRGYFDAQIGLINAVKDELLSVVQIYKVLGGGW